MITIQKSVVQNLLANVSPTVQAGSIFSLPVLATQLTWQTIFVGTPTAISIQILVSSDGINFNVLDSSTVTTGESKTNITSSNFIKASIVSITPGACTAVTVNVVAEPGGGTINSGTGGGAGPQGPQGIQGVPGPAPSGTGYAHVTGGVLDQPAQLYIDIAESIPASPPADIERIYALDVNGYTQIEMKDSVGRGARLASDNIIIAKITQAAGIARGQVVFIAGAAGANALVQLARSDAIATMPGIGIALDAGALNAFTRVLTSGTLQGVDTSAFTEGVSLFVSPTVAGGFTTTLPVAPAYAQRVGFVTRSHATQGEILVLTTGTVTDPRLHALTHAAGGTDPVTITTLAGYPGGATNFLRADGTFAAPATGVPGAHHATHEPGGADFLVNSVWSNLHNIFTAIQEINYGIPILALQDSSGVVDQRRWQFFVFTDFIGLGQFNDSGSGGQPSFEFHRDGRFVVPAATNPRILFNNKSQAVDQRIFDVVNTGALFIISASNDALTASSGFVSMDRNGVWTVAAGLGATPLNASQLTSGTVSDARLPANLARTDAINQFTLKQRISNQGGDLPRITFKDITQPVDSRVWEIITNGGSFTVWALNDAENAVQGTLGLDRAGNFAFTGTMNGGTVPVARLSGIIPDAQLTPNVALLNRSNQFTATQVIHGSGEAGLNLIDDSNGILIRLLCYQSLFQIYSNQLGTGVFKVNPVNGDVAVLNGLYERGRTVQMGDWIDFSPTVAANVGNATLNVVSEAKYMLVGHTMTINFYINVIVDSNPGAIYMVIPAGATSNDGSYRSMFVSPGAGGVATMDAAISSQGSSQFLTMSLVPGANFISTGQWLSGSISFAIQ